MLPDPHSPGTAQSIRAQVAFARDAQAEANEAADMINHLEKTRSQVEGVEATMGKEAARNAAAIEAAPTSGFPSTATRSTRPT